MPILLHIVAQSVGQEHRFDRFPIMIGRLPESQIVVKDSQISRRHARIVADPTGVYLEDLNSTNFVYINGVKVLRGLLNHGDVINVGGVADFIFLNRKDPDLVVTVLRRMPTLPVPESPGQAVDVMEALQSPMPPPLSGALPPQATRPIRVAAPEPPPAPPPPPGIPVEQAQALRDIAYKLLASTEPAEGLTALVDRTVTALEAQRGFLLIRSQRLGFADDWQVRVARSAGAEELAGGERESYARELAERSIVVDETSTSLQLGLDTSLWGAKSLPKAMREVVCTPLKAGNTVLGVLCLDGCKAEGQFPPRTLLLFELFADWAAEALERQRLTSLLSEQNGRFLKTAEELRTINRKLRVAEEKLTRVEAAPAPEPPRPAEISTAPGLESTSTTTSPFEEPDGTVWEPPPEMAPEPDDTPAYDPIVFPDPGESGFDLAAAGDSKRPLPDPDVAPGGAQQLGMPPRLAALAKQQAQTPTSGAGALAPSPRGSALSGLASASAVGTSPGGGRGDGAVIPGLVGKSPQTLELFAKAKQVARYFEVVLISGELGTGKKTLARAIHGMSDRAKRSFIHFPCASFRELEIEKRLFGHVETRQVSGEAMSRGQIERAAGGVLFLEDVDRLPMPAQSRLYFFLAHHRFQRVGADEEIPVDVKVIVTTTKSLKDEVESGAFHHDLFYYRIGVVNLFLPPLTERTDDIIPLASGWLSQFNKRFKKTIRGLSNNVKTLFCTYPWKGNLMELRNTLEAAVMVGTHRDLEIVDLPPALQEYFRRNQDAMVKQIIRELR